ncbi:MAG: UDP-N-acetylmuramate--L-alanine ligase [Muribaculaceae bacterium]|nr:UDP-N-acetylmuramate--L-alanine ligase [Muribaculaceae bacterium]
MNYFFIGAGGIGMANLVRYFLSKGEKVAGYDRVRSQLSSQLEEEGAHIIYDDDPALIPADFLNQEETAVVFTPAVPATNRIFSFYRNGGFEMHKRAWVLGRITRSLKGICVAGSHGKTTTSSMIAWVMEQSHVGCNAFLGGILRNVGSNLIVNPASDFAVVEADEYDRSFHQLEPYIAVITSADPDHLDIYGDEEHYLEAFSHFTSLIRPGGALLLHTGLKVKPETGPDVKVYTYSGLPSDTADWTARNIRYGDGEIRFDLHGPDGLVIDSISPGVPVEINVDNAVAAAAAAHLAGVSADEIRRGLQSFKGAKRRFEIILDGKSEPSRAVLIDDYAHSPAEISASIGSIRKLYPGRRISVIFQPHLYSRTRDFAPQFAEALSLADETILTEIYPARELPIPGVSSEIIRKDIKGDARLVKRADLLDLIKFTNFDILITLGAADLDTLLPDIVEILKSDVETGN